MRIPHTTLERLASWPLCNGQAAAPGICPRCDVRRVLAAYVEAEAVALAASALRSLIPPKLAEAGGPGYDSVRTFDNALAAWQGGT